MGIHVRWDSDSCVPAQTVIYWEVEEQWSWQDFSYADSISIEMANSVQHIVHILANFSRMKSLPLRGAIAYFNQSISNRPANRGKVVVVTQHRALKAMDPILRLLNPKAMESIHGFETLDEAYDLLQSHLN